MSIIIKNDEQIKNMRIAGEIVARTHEILEKEIRVGITTMELDKIAEEYIRSRGGLPSFLGYSGYPATINASINEEIVHGIPSLRTLKNGDIIGIDIGASYNGYHGDAARTHGVGIISAEDQRLIDVTRQSFFEGLKFAKSGNHLNQVCEAIGNHIEKNGFSVVRDYVGHGIGKSLHESPQIPNYKMKSRGPKLQKGMVLAIEPMANIGTFELTVLDDGWTSVTLDGKNSSHYENTVLITDGEPELLTI